MWDALLSIVAATGANALLLSVLAFLLKRLLSHRFEKDIEAFKTDLARSAEKFRSDLERERLRYQITAGGIFERQAIALLEAYKDLAG